MKLLPWALATLLLVAGPAEGTPQAGQGESQSGETAVALFDPPLDMPIRFRSESTIVSKKGTQSRWSISSYAFSKQDNGYRLTVTPETSGSNSTDSLVLETEQKLAELSRKPFVVLLNEDAEITGIEDMGRYWTAIFDAIGETIKEDRSLTPEIRTALTSFMNNYRSLPPESQLALMTEEISPIVNYANSEIAKGEPIRTSIEDQSPFGGSVQYDIYINLDRIEDDLAVIRTHVTIAPADMARIVTAFLEKMTAGMPGAEKLPKEELAKLDIRHETRAEHRVSLIDGLLVQFTSTETIDVKTTDGSDQQGRVESKKVERLD